jgi:hypothetical protein
MKFATTDSKPKRISKNANTRSAGQRFHGELLTQSRELLKQMQTR